MEIKKIEVIHIPEVCYYNTFIEIITQIQRNTNIDVLVPGILHDVPNAPEPFFKNSIKYFSRDAKKIVHFHWPEKLYRRINHTEFINELDNLKKENVILVKTIHNLKPHEINDEKENRLEQVFNSMIDKFILFSNAQLNQFVNEYPQYRHKCEIIPHPNYFTNVVKNEDNINWRCRVRAKYNIPHNTLCFLAIGRLRHYKRIDVLLDALRLIKLSNIRLVIVGNPDELAIHELIQTRAAKDTRIIYISKFVEEKDIQELLLACDIVTLPYEKPWSSGVAILASNYGKPILGSVPLMFDLEHSEYEDVGFISTQINITAEIISELMRKAHSVNNEGLISMGANFKKMTGRYNNEEIGEMYHKLYQNL
ncbi:glycosyltransferase family 4 protein [Paenibacillus sp. 32O-W]|uniref:glycosyltransferase family 4 protein n=1 Tax=Paenibacillus sp. 32O-W TaxID=1695218 RepID=UPI0016425F19|nr:glycosyltransferase family 4 protein [Paenibacillus sp. 32O-W]